MENQSYGGTNTNDLICHVCLVYVCGFLLLNILILMSIAVILLFCFVILHQHLRWMSLQCLV